jgi:hypothetical protein
MTPNQTLSVAAIGAFLALVGLLVLIGILGTVYVAVCRAIDTRNDRRARRAARTRHIQATTAADDAVTIALNSACCETWWTSTGTHHDTACPNHTRKERR